MIDRYKDAGASAIWSELEKYRTWAKIETTYINSLLGSDYEVLDIYEEDIKDILEIEKIRKHDVAAFVEWYESKFRHVAGDLSRYVHFGLTSSDIVDTGLSMTIKRSNDRILMLTNNLIEVLSSVADDRVMPGRTHGKYAESVKIREKFNSYGSVLSNLTSEIKVCEYPGRLRGPVGDMKHIHEFFPSFNEHKVLFRLGCVDSKWINGQIISRAYHAGIMSKWAVMSSYIEKIATDMRILAMDGIGEITEGFNKGQIGSSSMPHKKNPIGFENICGISRIVRSYVQSANESIALWNERDISHSSVERIIFPDAVNLLCYQLVKLESLISGMSINYEVIDKNMAASEIMMGSHKSMLDNIHLGGSRTSSHSKERNRHGT